MSDLLAIIAVLAIPVLGMAAGFAIIVGSVWLILSGLGGGNRY